MNNPSVSNSVIHLIRSLIRLPDVARSQMWVMRFGAAVLVLAVTVAPALAQSVCLPAPRLLTTVPMGGRAGTQVEVVITGEHLDGAAELLFSSPLLKGTAKLDGNGKPVPNQYVIDIAADCPTGVYEARLMTRLGLSSSRVFSVGQLPEVTRQAPNTSLESAMSLEVNSVCNAIQSSRAVDHYAFQGVKGQRLVVDVASRTIDSKLDAVLVVADARGRDLFVDRRGGLLDFTVPEDGRYIIKVHDLTFKGGETHFYRLAVRELSAGAAMVRQPGTHRVNSFSWPPVGLPEAAAVAEVEPNNDASSVQKITLPCDISGSFFPAADVDVFEFAAKAGEEWWVEVASERLGLPTDPAVLVQQVTKTGDTETVADLVEFSDVPSPVKVSSNGYAYDGPPYDSGTADPLGKLSIKADGIYRIRLSDLFGGTREDARNVYRLIVRKAQPDFALVAWAMHMELRNGDRNALSKPISLRGGSTMALEVIAYRRDGFDGAIDVTLDGLPEGMSATGLRIPAGQSRGMVLVTAAENAPRGFGAATFTGKATIGDAVVTRPCRLASVAWPIPDSWGEIPYTRLTADVPVSVGGVDRAPLTVAPKQAKIEAVAGQTIKIPLTLVKRSDFSGTTMNLRPIGPGFERVAAFDMTLTADGSEATVDLAALKTPPGEYVLAFYGSAVAKYRHQPEQIAVAEEARVQAQAEVEKLTAEVAQADAAAQAAAPAEKAAATQAAADLAAKKKQAEAALTASVNRVKQVTDAAQPRDIVDIIVTEPVQIRVQPMESK
jgi:hypothetical protein